MPKRSRARKARRGTAKAEVSSAEEIVARLRKLASPRNVAGMARFGISAEGTLGVPMPVLRRIARETGRDHRLAAALWRTGIHEARILAALTAEPDRLTEAQADRWVGDLDSWDVCDQLCMDLLDKAPFAYAKAVEWAGPPARGPGKEFVRRAGFALMAVLAWHDKGAPDSEVARFLPHIERGAADERNYVKKAVSWALRHIGKRSAGLNGKAVRIARRLARSDSASARWVGRDALRELTSEKVRARLGLGGG